MREEPSGALLELLDRLELATAAEVRCPRPGTAARGDCRCSNRCGSTLAQARVLSSFQAAEINAGRGDRLAVGPFVVRRPLRSTGFAEVFEARAIQTRRDVRLIVARLTHPDIHSAERRLESLLAAFPHLAEAGIAAVHLARIESSEAHPRLWAASDPVEGITAAEWMIADGRLPPLVVLEIARQMAADLVGAGTIRTRSRRLEARRDWCFRLPGRARFPHPGIRAIVRPRRATAGRNCRPRPATGSRRNGLPRGPRRTRTASCSPVDACGGTCSPGDRRSRGATAWRSSRGRSGGADRGRLPLGARYAAAAGRGDRPMCVGNLGRRQFIRRLAVAAGALDPRWPRRPLIACIRA